jgi:hypothetical protein
LLRGAVGSSLDGHPDYLGYDAVSRIAQMFERARSLGRVDILQCPHGQVLSLGFPEAAPIGFSRPPDWSPSGKPAERPDNRFVVCLTIVEQVRDRLLANLGAGYASGVDPCNLERNRAHCSPAFQGHDMGS